MRDKRESVILIVSLLIIVIMMWTTAVAVELSDIQGVYGLESTGSGAYLAIKVPIPEEVALSGVLWYNNDETTTFPAVLVGTGIETSPGLLTDFLGVAENIHGISSGWSEVEFSEPIAASLGALYLVFEFPMEQVLEEEGCGGGPGIGYASAEEGYPGWLSGDGEVWARLHRSFSFAVLPTFVPFEAGMAVKNFDGEVPEIEEAVADNFLGAAPNPFNPSTEVQFGLIAGGDVKIDIFDVRGRHVVALQDGHLQAGRHSILWNGLDSGDRGVASGVFFVRLVGEGFRLTEKVLLLK